MKFDMYVSSLFLFLFEWNSHSESQVSLAHWTKKDIFDGLMIPSEKFHSSSSKTFTTKKKKKKKGILSSAISNFQVI